MCPAVISSGDPETTVGMYLRRDSAEAAAAAGRASITAPDTASVREDTVTPEQGTDRDMVLSYSVCCCNYRLKEYHKKQKIGTMLLR